MLGTMILDQGDMYYCVSLIVRSGEGIPNFNPYM